MGVFEDYAYYYDLFYQEKDYHGEAELVREELIKNNINTGRILSFGCETGKYEHELADYGYNVHGIDMSAEMVEIANEKAKNNVRLSFEVADIRKYQPDKKYHAVISLFKVMSCQTSNTDMIDAMKSAKASLLRGCGMGPVS